MQVSTPSRAVWALVVALGLAPCAAGAQTPYLPEPLLPPPALAAAPVQFDAFAQLPATYGTARGQFLTPADDGTSTLFAIDERGVVYRVSADGATVTPFLDVTKRIPSFLSNGAEEGLTGFAPHPNFAAAPGTAGRGVFYTHISVTHGAPDFLGNYTDHDEVIEAWFADNPTAATFSGTNREILRIGKYAGNHNGGVIRFNPNAGPGAPDFGLLYVGFGDGGGGGDPYNNGQDLTSPLGKVLRFRPAANATDPAYAAPADNPFLAQSGAGPLIWAYGLRNPQQFSFEIGRLGRLFVDDIGQNNVEEVNVVVRGGNYGWSLREGTFATAKGVSNPQSDPNDGLPVYAEPPGDGGLHGIYPVAEYDHSDDAEDGGRVGAAIGSGFVYRGRAVPAFAGKYVFVDFVRGRLYTIPVPAAFSRRTQPISQLAIRYNGADYDSLDSSPLGAGGRADLRLGEDAAGELYALLKTTGAIYRIVPAP